MRRIGVVATSVVVMVLVYASTMAPVMAQDISELKWFANQYNDEGNRGVMTSSLSFAIPETDAIMVSGFCTARSTAASAPVSFGYDTGRMKSGDRARMRFFGKNFRASYTAFAVIPESGEGLQGFVIDIPFDDPLWGALKGLNFVRYSINDGPTIRLPLRGSGRAVSSFLKDCLFYAANMSGGGSEREPQRPVNDQPTNKPPSNQPVNPVAKKPVPINGGTRKPSVPLQPSKPLDPRWATCDTLANAKSERSDTLVTVTFVNRSDGARGINWVNYEGMPQSFAMLNAGEEYSVQTYLTHPWMFTDGPGNCLEMMLPQQGVSRFEITAPNRDFGPE